jgi:uncharacterized protein (TIGR00369 family)
MNNEERKDFLTAVRTGVAELPFHRLLGLNIDCYDAENGCIRFDMRDELVGNKHFKILHGGVIASILDTEGGFVLVLDGAWRSENALPANPVIIRGGTIDLRIDFLRPGKGKHFVATGAVLRRGNKVAVVRTELRNELNELIAVGTGTYLVG